MALSWVLVDARTGVIRANAQRVVADRPCAVTMGTYEPLTASLPYPESVIGYANNGAGTKDAALAALSDWKTATRAGANNLIAIDEFDNPIWGGLILKRTRDHTVNASLDCYTLEAYLARRYAGVFNLALDQNELFAQLVEACIADGTLPGLPIRVVYTASAQTQTVNLDPSQNSTIADIAQRLTAIPGGIRWTIKWERQHSPERITPVLYVSDRLGQGTPTGLASPNAMFSMPGNVQAFQVIEDYTSGPTGGANIVTMNGAGQPAEQWTVYASDYAGRPAFEYRGNPQTSTGSIQLTMAQHAAAALAILQDGSTVLSVTARVANAPRVGSDYDIGNDVGYDLMAPGVIDGELSTGVGQCIGWQRDDTNQSPILAVADASTV